MNLDHPLYPTAHQRLLDDLTAMIDTTRGRSVVFDYPVYAQWAAYGPGTGLHIEMTGPKFLPKGKLSPVDMALLRDLMLKGPDDLSPNFYWRVVGDQFDLFLIAHWVLVVMVDAYHVPEDVVLTKILLKVPAHPKP